MTDYYVINDHIAGHRPLVYTQNEFIKSLNNFTTRKLLNDIAYLFPNTFTMYSNVSKIYLEDYLGWWYDLHIECDSHKPLSTQQLAQFQTQAANYLAQVQAQESYDGQVNALIQADAFGKTISLPTIIKNPQTHWGHQPKSHNGHGTYKAGGRAGHTQSTFARDNHWHKLDLKALHDNPDFKNVKIRHLNRRYHNHHPIDFPVFDDDEYLESKDSTGWKHSSKARHQYNQHYGQPANIDKRQLSHLYNDWTDADDFDAAGSDYYAKAWWYHEPDPNLTPMANKSISQRFYDTHDPSKKLKYITRFDNWFIRD